MISLESLVEIPEEADIHVEVRFFVHELKQRETRYCCYIEY